jgi:hypothetical protein
MTLKQNLKLLTKESGFRFNFVDITNQKFGKLLAISPKGSDKHGNVLWECKCKCGQSVVTLGTSLRSGKTRSCGCIGKIRIASLARLGGESAKKKGHEYFVNLGKIGHKIRKERGDFKDFYINKDGYIAIPVGNGKLMRLNRYVMEQHLGRKLEPDEQVHHIDKNPANNDISNLLLTNKYEHCPKYHPVSEETKEKLRKSTSSRWKILGVKAFNR